MPEVTEQIFAFLLQLLIALTAVVACAMSHYHILQHLQKRVKNIRLGARGLVVLFCGITLSQLVAAFWFSIAFYLSISMGLGEIDGGRLNQLIELFYFSLINLTTLGLGQIEVTHHLPFLAGIEAMTGFLLVSCSASLLIRYMNHK